MKVCVVCVCEMNAFSLAYWNLEEVYLGILCQLCEVPDSLNPAKTVSHPGSYDLLVTSFEP